MKHAGPKHSDENSETFVIVDDLRFYEPWWRLPEQQASYARFENELHHARAEFTHAIDHHAPASAS